MIESDKLRLRWTASMEIVSYASHGILPDAGRTCELRSAAANCGYASGIMPAV